MGKSQSTPWILEVETDKSWYAVGESVKGTITLRTSTSLPVSTLTFRLKRREKMQMETYPICGLHANQAFYKVKTPFRVTSFVPGVREAGSYRYPFEFPIPANGVNSFLFGRSKGPCRFAYLRYYIVAKVNDAAGVKIKGETDIEVVHRAALIEKPIPVENSAVCSACGASSVFAIRLSFDKSAYCYGETARCEVLLEGERARVVLGKLTLWRDIYVSSGAIGFSAKSRIGAAKNFGYQRSGRKSAGAGLVTVLFPIPRKQVHTTPSLESHLIRCGYLFKLDVVGRACCGKVEQVLEMPVTVYDPRGRAET